ncbi:MAG: histidinol-phosphatase HisJ family protein [Erysipelotrichaceae bacterium]
MYLVDSHVHLEKGPLTKEYVLEFINEAIRNNIDELHILDHTHRFKEFYHCYDELRDIEIQSRWLGGKFKNTLDEYDELIREMKKMSFPIKVLYGLEVCYTPKSENILRDVLKDRHYDFLIGSIHSIDSILYDMGFSKELLWEKYDTDLLYKHYYEAVKKLIKSDLFTSVGHMDNVKLFGYVPKCDMTDTYNEIADLLVEHHLLCENNSGCFYRYGCKDIGLSDELIGIFKKKGVSFITASDAHNVSDVGKLIKEASERVKSSV